MLDRGTSLVPQIVRQLSAHIRLGRLAVGTRLPSSRALCRQIGVSRSTVTLAYDELISQGLVTAEQARGVFVADTQESMPVQLGISERSQTIGFDLPNALPDGVGHSVQDNLPVECHWDFGVPDVRLAPALELGRALRGVLKNNAEKTLSYWRPRANETTPLQRATTELLNGWRGLSVAPSQVVMTRGSQMALHLVARTLLQPNDVVAVEDPGYNGAWSLFHAMGARTIAIPCDEQGLNVAALERVAQRVRIRAVFVTPHHQFPTTVTLSGPRRRALLRFAAKHRVAIIEDDYDHEFHFDGRSRPPLAASDERGLVLYVGSFSKIVAPGLRVGYVVAPQPMSEHLQRARSMIDLQADLVLDAALAQLLNDGVLRRYWRRARRIYRTRRDHLVLRLQERLDKQLRFQSPSGGLAVWAEVKTGDLDAWFHRARQAGLWFRCDRPFRWANFMGKDKLRSEPSRFLRLGFARLDPTEIDRAVELLWRTRPR